MCTEHRFDGGGLEFEKSLGRTDLQVSRVLTTPKGDKIRAMVTTGQSILLAPIGQSNGDTITVIGDPGSATPFSLGDIWDKIKEAVAEGIKILSGGGCRPVTTTTITTHKDGTATIVQTTTCGPA
jgi:hypothetical protein